MCNRYTHIHTHTHAHTHAHTHTHTHTHTITLLKSVNIQKICVKYMCKSMESVNICMKHRFICPSIYKYILHIFFSCKFIYTIHRNTHIYKHTRHRDLIGCCQYIHLCRSLSLTLNFLSNTSKSLSI